MEYTVQFQETDLDFVERLMSMFGISYYFRHEMHAHELVLFDEVDSLPAIPGGSRAYRVIDRQQRRESEHLHDWSGGRRMTTGRVAMTDYNFTAPRSAMQTEPAPDRPMRRAISNRFSIPAATRPAARATRWPTCARSRSPWPTGCTARGAIARR